MGKRTSKPCRLRNYLLLGAGLAAGLFWISPFPLLIKYHNLRSRRDAPEIGGAMARLTETVKERGYLMSNDPRFPPELKRIKADRVFVSAEDKIASVYFGSGHYGFGYVVRATETPDTFIMRSWSDTDDDPPSWIIKP